MSTKKSLEQEFREFCSNNEQDIDEESSFRSKLKDVAVEIKTDLVTSKWKLCFYYLASSIGGYIATLLICAQGGVGISEFSHRTTEAMMHTFPHPWCAIICGALFSGIPFLVSLGILNRFQHRYLLFRMPWLLLLTPLLAAFIFHTFGVWEHESLPFLQSSFESVWLLSAILTPYLFEGILAIILRQRSYTKSSAQV